jgi:hypothetical protein
MRRQEPTTIAILGAGTVVENAIALLLGSAGYSVRTLSDPSAVGAKGQLDGVDLVLLAPAVGEEDKEAFLNAIEAAPAAGDVRVLALSTARKQELAERTGVVPWPIPLEGLGRAIEAGLSPAPAPAEGDG